MAAVRLKIRHCGVETAPIAWPRKMTGRQQQAMRLPRQFHIRFIQIMKILINPANPGETATSGEGIGVSTRHKDCIRQVSRLQRAVQLTGGTKSVKKHHFMHVNDVKSEGKPQTTPIRGENASDNMNRGAVTAKSCPRRSQSVPNMKMYH